MRVAVLAVISAIALAACNPSAPSGDTADSAASSGGGLFPNLTSASYRAEGTIYGDEGQTVPIVQIRSGAKMRMEFNAGGGQITVVNNGGDGQDFALINAGGRTFATTAGLDQYDNPAADWSTQLGSRATRTGSCSVAGENGAEWSSTDEAGEVSTACVTEDGIMLRATKGGRTVWETQTVTRGAQAADLFVIPAGVQVMNIPGMGQ